MPKVALTDKPGVTNWVEKYNALPKGSWIRRAAEHLKGKGHDEHSAIPIAVKAAEKLCATGDLNFPGVQQASAGSRAEACAAVAVWKRAAARAKADLSVPAMAAFNLVELSKVQIGAGWVGVREPPDRAVIDLTTDQLATIDLAKSSRTGTMAKGKRTAKQVLADRIYQAIKNDPKFKNLPEAKVREAANRGAERGLQRRADRQAIGVQNVNKASAKTQRRLQRAGALPGKGGQPISYTITRGRRKGQTIQIRRKAGGGWTEVKPKAA